MWHWLLILSSPILLNISSFAAKNDFSASDAKVLWQRGTDLFSEGRFSEAIDPLQRIVHRFPGYPGYIDAHYLLGQAMIRTEKYKESLKPLRYFIQATPNDASAAEARLFLGGALMKLRQFEQAILVSLEIEGQENLTNGRLKAKGLLLRAQAQISLHQEPRAIRSLDSARRFMEGGGNDQEAEAEARYIEFRLKTGACARLANNPRISNAQLANQLDRRGTCLLEATTLRNRISETRQTHWIVTATADLDHALSSYSMDCKISTDRRPGKAEINDFLRQACGMKYSEAATLLKKTQPTLPEACIKRSAQLIKKLELLAKTI